VRALADRIVASFERAAGAIDRHPVAFFAMVAVWLSFEFWAFGSGSYVWLHDNGDAILPGRIALSLWRTIGPPGLWASQWVAGVDRLAQGVDVSILPFLVLPGWLAYGLVMFGQRLLAGLFAYKLAREELGTWALAALLTGIAYASFVQPSINGATSGFTLYDGFGLPALPLVLWTLGRSVRARKWAGIGLAAMAGVALAVSCSYPFGVFVLAAGWWWLLVATVGPDRPRRTSATRLGAFTAGWALVTLPLALPAVALAPMSQRIDWVVSSNVLADVGTRVAFSGSLIADNYVPLLLAGALLVAATCKGAASRSRALVVAGLVTLLLAPLSLLLSIPSTLVDPSVLLAVRWIVAAVLAVVLAASAFLTRGRARSLTVSLLAVLTFVAMYPLVRSVLWQVSPTIAGFQWDRLYLLVPLMGLLLGAEAVSVVARRQGSSRASGSGTAALLCCAIVVVLASTIGVKLLESHTWSSHFSYRTLFEKPVLQRLRASTSGEPPFRVVTAVQTSVTIEPGFMWAYGLETADGYVNVYDKSYKDFWAQVVRRGFAMSPADAESFGTWGNRVSLWTAWTDPSRTAARAAAREGDALFDLDLLSLANVRYVISPQPISDSRLRLVDSGDGLTIYENTQALPRFYLASGTRTFATDAALFRDLGTSEASDLATTVYLTGSQETTDVSRGATATTSPGTVRMREYAADRISLDVGCSRDCWLVASQTRSPFWTATMDGQEVEIESAYGAFQCLRLPKGSHRVTFEYRYPGLPSAFAGR
jgi:hypothetical protein